MPGRRRRPPRELQAQLLSPGLARGEGSLTAPGRSQQRWPGVGCTPLLFGWPRSSVLKGDIQASVSPQGPSPRGDPAPGARLPRRPAGLPGLVHSQTSFCPSGFPSPLHGETFQKKEWRPVF